MHMLFTVVARKCRALLPILAIPMLAGCATVAMGSPISAQQPTPAPTAASGGNVPPTAAPTAISGSVFYWYVLDSAGKPARSLACLNQPSGDTWVCQQRNGEKIYFSPAVPLMVTAGELK